MSSLGPMYILHFYQSLNYWVFFRAGNYVGPIYALNVSKPPNSVTNNMSFSFELGIMGNFIKNFMFSKKICEYM